MERSEPLGLPAIGEGLEEENIWDVIEEYPDRMVLGLNIRDRSEEFVDELARSILSQGQIQECTGDMLVDGTVRVWAGQHRFWAVEKINTWIRVHNSKNPDLHREKFKLRVRVLQRVMADDEVLQIQIAENLHKDMRPEEEAGAIRTVFDFYKKVVGESASLADFSRRVGLGESKVANAVRYTGSDSRVKSLVENNSLLYSIATEISRLPADKQFGVAMKVVLYNLSRESARTLIRGTLQEEQESSLFIGEQKNALEKDNHRLAFRNAADRAAKDASGYFRRVIAVLEILEEPERVTMTDTIRDILSNFIYSASYFRVQLGGDAPQLLKLLESRVLRVIAERMGDA